MQNNDTQSMQKTAQNNCNKLKYLFLACRPKFLTAAVIPVIVGSSLGFVVTDSFSHILFILALLSIMALHAGANVANDYFDHISKNDWLNKNVTQFSGGTRYIQDGILSPKATLLISLFYLTLGAILGLVIVILSRKSIHRCFRYNRLGRRFLLYRTPLSNSAIVVLVKP